MTHQCAGITRSGERCTHTAKGPSGFCHLHDPDRAAERKRNASRAGKSSGTREITSIKAQLAEMVETVLGGVASTAPYAVANQILNTRLQAIELERKAREADELEARIEQLEQGPEARKGGQKMGDIVRDLAARIQKLEAQLGKTGRRSLPA